LPGVDPDPFGHDEESNEDDRTEVAHRQHVDATGHDDRRV
jgi:hypothetical protein